MLGLHGRKPLSQIPQQSLPLYNERFYSFGVLGCRSFSFGINIDFLTSQEDYPRASPIGMSVRDESFLQGGRLESPNEVWLCRRQYALFEAGLAISSRHVAFGKLFSLMKPEERCSIPIFV